MSLLSVILFPEDHKLGDRPAYEILRESRKAYHEGMMPEGVERLGFVSTRHLDPDTQQESIAFATSREFLPQNFEEAKAMVMANAGHSKEKGTADAGDVSLAAYDNGYIGPQFGIIKRSDHSPGPVAPPAGKTGAAVAIPRTKVLVDLVLT